MGDGGGHGEDQHIWKRWARSLGSVAADRRLVLRPRIIEQPTSSYMFLHPLLEYILTSYQDRIQRNASPLPPYPLRTIGAPDV